MNVLVHRWGQSPHDPGATFSTCFLCYIPCFFPPPTLPFRKSSSIAVWKQQWVNDKYLISLNCHKVDTLSPKIYIVSRNATRSYLWTLMYWVATWESLGARLIFYLSTDFRESKLEILGTVYLTLPPHSSWSSLFLEQIHVTDTLLRLQSEFTPTHLCPDPPGWALRWAALTPQYTMRVIQGDGVANMYVEVWRRGIDSRKGWLGKSFSGRILQFCP